jgi:predicted nucleic acid-binding protein
MAPYRRAGKMPFTGSEEILLDAGVFIGALLKGDSRHHEAKEIVEAARSGLVNATTTAGILCEVYGALTWHMSSPPQIPATAAAAVLAIINDPSQIGLLTDNLGAFQLAMSIAERCNLTARRIHDARHAATAIYNGVHFVCTYDEADWKLFEPGITIVRPADLLAIRFA